MTDIGLRLVWLLPEQLDTHTHYQGTDETVTMMEKPMQLGNTQWMSANNGTANWSLGAHLVTPRFGYEHHGIYVGNNRVIHYAGWCERFRIGPVEEVLLREFSAGQPVFEIAHPNAKYIGDQVVNRARSRLGENRYSLWHNNCEHLCSWSIEGISFSAQVVAVTTKAVYTANELRQVAVQFGSLIRQLSVQLMAYLASKVRHLIATTEVNKFEVHQ